MSAHQFLHAAGRLVEAFRERGDLVTALHLHPRRQVTFAELFDTCFQPFQASRQTPRHRVGAQRDSDRDDDQEK